MILADLIKQELSGDELLAKFKTTQTNIRPAVEAMMDDAGKIANATTKYSTYDDIFDTTTQA